jgi:hypothetical protein
MIKRFLIVLICGCLHIEAGQINAVSMEYSAVNAAIASANEGDTINLPADTVTWTYGTAQVTINKSVRLIGVDTSQCMVILGSGGGLTSTCCIISTDSVWIKNIKFVVNADRGDDGFISISGNRDGFRITKCRFESNGNPFGYSIYAASYGLIDSCYFHAGNETVFVRGYSNSWQTNSSLGTQDAIFMEANTAIYDNTTGYSGILVDANDNARIVFRNNYLEHFYFDGHGACTNSLRGVRHYEVYKNTTDTIAASTVIHLRGGTGFVFDNIINTAGSLESQRKITLRDYAYELDGPSGCNGYAPQCGCIGDYPLNDQIGVGKDPKVGASEPIYLWGNRKLTGDTIGLYFGTVSADCQDSCNDMISTPNNFITANRDYYNEKYSSFDGTSGIKVGTYSAMTAQRTCTNGTGFWVTDMSDDWCKDCNDGVLYKCDGNNKWIKFYTPYSYPHPLAGGSTKKLPYINSLSDSSGVPGQSIVIRVAR